METQIFVNSDCICSRSGLVSIDSFLLHRETDENPTAQRQRKMPMVKTQGASTACILKDGPGLIFLKLLKRRCQAQNAPTSYINGVTPLSGVITTVTTYNSTYNWFLGPLCKGAWFSFKAKKHQIYQSFILLDNLIGHTDIILQSFRRGPVFHTC